MRILHIFGGMNLGGAERRTVALLPHVGAEHPQHFATLSGEPGTLDALIHSQGGTVHPCRRGPGFAARFTELVRAIEPDVVHSHIHWASAPILALSRALRVPGRILHFRASGDLRPASRRRRLRDRGLRLLANHSATRVLAVSEGAMEATWGLDWRDDPRCAVLYSGVDREPFTARPDRAGVREELRIPTDARILTHVGNIAPAKNHARLGRLFGALGHAHEDLWLLAIGGTKDPSCERALRSELESAGLSERAVLAGQREDVPRLLLASDGFLFPSRTEGLPGAVLEAREAGLPVVASDLPGICEIARHVPGVQTLSLDQPDATWLLTLNYALAAGVDPPGQLAGSPFTAEASATAHVAAWAESIRRS